MSTASFMFSRLSLILLIVGTFVVMAGSVKMFWDETPSGKLKWCLLLCTFFFSPFLIYATRLVWISKSAVFQILINMPLQKPEDLFAMHTVKAMVYPNDLDIFFHMNNSRYQHQIDIARSKFYIDSGLARYFRQKMGYMLVSATTARYRKELLLFQSYNISSKIVYWDEDSFYLEHRITSQYGKMENFVYYVCFQKLRVMYATPEGILKDFLQLADAPPKPPVTAELESFIKFNTSSSDTLRRESGVLPEERPDNVLPMDIDAQNGVTPTALERRNNPLGPTERHTEFLSNEVSDVVLNRRHTFGYLPAS